MSSSLPVLDMHNHLMPDESVFPEYERAAEELGLERIVFLGLEWPGCPYSRNDAIREAMRRRPDLAVGFAGVNMWDDVDPDRIDRFRDEGFKGLKFILPPATYHDERFYPYYDRAEALGMPVVFHLGIISAVGTEQVRADSNLMRPIYLDTIARTFRDLTIIGAHFGNPWYDEAAMSARWNPNLFFDLTGSTLKKKSPQFINDLLWWDETTDYRSAVWSSAWEQIIFGTDTAPDKMGGVREDYEFLFEVAGLSEEFRRAVLYETGVSILRFAGVEL